MQIETLKTKLIGANAGVWEGTKMILAKEGVRGIYQGLFATILKQVSCALSRPLFPCVVALITRVVYRSSRATRA